MITDGRLKFNLALFLLMRLCANTQLAHLLAAALILLLAFWLDALSAHWCILKLLYTDLI